MLPWGAGALIALIAPPVIAEARRTPIAVLRRGKGGPGKRVPGKVGQFATLSQGVTHFRWFGGDDPAAPVFVMVHGLTSASYVWQAMAPGLVATGARVLVYDLYGRGLSDRPRGRQDRAFFTRQLHDLLQDQGIGAPVHLVGYSLGGGIAAAFAAAHPDRVATLLLPAPAGFSDTPSPFAEFTRKWPLIGDWANMVFGGRDLRGKIGRGPASQVADMNGRQLAEIGTRGYMAAILSTRRHMLTEDLSREHASFGARHLPVLAIWGEADRVVPLRARDEMARANPAARHVVLQGAGHSMVHTQPDQVVAAILGFLGADLPA